MRILRSLPLLFILLLAPVGLSAQSAIKIVSDAKFMERDFPSKTITLRGNVNIAFQDNQILCDEALIFEKKSLIIAEGNVTLKTPKTTIRGVKVEYNYETGMGKIYEGIVTSGQVLMESPLIEKVGEEEYVAEDAYYTSCLTCPPSWGFTARRVRAEIGGYAYITRPWFYLLEIPTIPLPYLALPLNTTRQTGLLPPKQNYTGRGGLAIEQPFFWAMGRSHDMTISALLHEFLGWQGLANYRYVISPESSGELNFGFINDRKFTAGNDTNRWFADYYHHYDLPNGYSQRLQVQYTSDQQYVLDFPEQMTYSGEPAFDNRASISKRFSDAVISADASYYVSLLDPIDHSNPLGLHRAPEINFGITERPLNRRLPILYQIEGQYLNVSRNDLSFDKITRATTNECGLDATGAPIPVCINNNVANRDTFSYLGTNANGNFGDLIRTGQRLDLKSSFSYPFWVGQLFDIEPRVNMRFTQYSLGVPTQNSQSYDSFPRRFYLQYKLSARSYLSRVYESSLKNRYKHSIIPELALQIVPLFEQTKSRFFGTGQEVPYFRESRPLDDDDLDIDFGGRGVQFDYRDRVIGRKLLRLSLTNKLLARAFNKPRFDFNQSMLFTVSTAYDLQAARDKENGLPWQAIEGLFQLNFSRFSLAAQSDYFPYHGRTNVASEVAYNYYKSNYVKIGYVLQYNIPLDPADTQKLEQQRTDSISLATGFRSKYLDFDGVIAYSPRGVDEPAISPVPPFNVYQKAKGVVTSWAFQSEIKPPGDCWSIVARVSKDYRSTIQATASMKFNFGQ